MFTGDSSGNFLYPALFRAGFASQPGTSSLEDGLILNNIFITSICRCAPPENKPSLQEQANCLPFLISEMALIQSYQGIVALGKLAFDQIINIFRRDGRCFGKNDFAHGAFYNFGIGQPWLLASYHPSRQNTQTRRLTIEMFDTIWQTAAHLINENEEKHV